MGAKGYHVERSMSFASTCTAAVLCALAFTVVMPLSAQTLQSGNTVRAENDPATLYLQAYSYCKTSEEQAAKKDYNAAIKSGNAAEKVLARIVKDFPGWKENLVSTRRKILAENLANYRKLAKEAPIPTGRQPGRPVTTVVELPETALPNPDAGATFDPATADKKLLNELSVKKEELRRMVADYKELRAKYEATQEELTKAQLEKKMYKERYDTLQEQVAAERAGSNSVFASLNQRLADMEARYHASEEARKAAESRVVELEKSLAETQAELERVTRERDALKAENEQLRAIVELNSPEKTKALLDQNLSLDQKLREAEARIAELEAQQAGSDDQQNVLAQQLDEARSEADRLRDEMGGIVDENIGYRRRVSELTERLNNLEAELEASAERPVVDPALAEENKILREVIAKQKRTLSMQEEGRKLLIETYKQIKNQDPATLTALQKLDEESSLDLTDAERRLMESVKGSEKGETEAADAVRTSLEVEALAKLAAKAFAKERYTAAEQLYRTLYESQPNHVAGLVNLGTILLYRNKCEEAVEYLNRASRLAPDLAISYYLTGISLYRLDRMAEARRMFARTVQLDPANAEAFFYLANIEGLDNDFEQALKHFAAAVKLNPALGDAHYNMARLYAELKKIPDAARAYDRAVQNGAEPDPEFEDFLRNHPDNAKKPGEDLVESVNPESEAADLRKDDPEMEAIIKARENDLPETEGENGEAADKGDAPAAEGETDAPEEKDDFLTALSKVQKAVKAVTSASPAGTAHEVDKKRFSSVTVNTRRNGKRVKVKLRLKKPAPQRLRQRGGEIRVLKK